MSELDREAVLAATFIGASRGHVQRDVWWAGAVIYEVYVRSFNDSTGNGVGDLHGVIQRLDYLADLGIDGIWLSPFYPSPQRDFGYDITALTEVDERFGTLDDFRELVAASHERKLKVLLDFVPIHTSDEHPWFTESRSSRDNPKADWYVWANAAPDGGPPSNWLSSFGGSAWTWEPRRSQYYFHPFLECQPALEQRTPAVMDALLDVMRFWLDLGVDGFRVDAVQCLSSDPDLRSNPPVGAAGSPVRIGGGPNNPFGRQVHIFDRDMPDAIAMMRNFRRLTDEYEPERVLIGELADVDSSRLAEKYTLADDRLHTVYDFDLINCRPSADAIVETIITRNRFIVTGWLMNVFSNHDSIRAVSNLTRNAVEAGHAREAAKMLLFLQLTLRGGAVLYQGEELGLPHPSLDYEDLQDPWGLNLWPDFEGRDGARTPMPWTAGADDDGFSSGEPWLPIPDEHRELAVERQQADPESCLMFAREFLRWRANYPLLRLGDEVVYDVEKETVIVYDRCDDESALRCFVNFGIEARTMPVETSWRVLEVPGGSLEVNDGKLHLPPVGFALVLVPRV